MGFLAGAEHDVFVSYAHLDDKPEFEGEKGWVEQFTELLSVRLHKRFGDEAVDVWRDPRKGQAQQIDQTIEKAVRNSGVMLSLISPRYLKSDYCSKETEWFHGKAQEEAAGFVIGGFQRIFPILLYDIPHPEWPPACQGVSAFRFHDKGQDDIGRPLVARDEAYRLQMRKLVKELHQVLSLMKKSLPRHTPTPELTAPGSSPFRVFVAEAADDLGPLKRQVVKALRREQIEVVSDVPPPHDSEEHARAAAEAISRVDLSVHILGRSPGEAIDEQQPEKTYPVEQARIGGDRARSQLVLLPEDLDTTLIDAAPYAAFLDVLANPDEETTRVEVVRTVRQRMIDEILEKKRSIEEARRIEAAATDPTTTAFIDLHMSDVPHATDLVGYLGRKRIVTMMVPSADLEPTMSLFEENLRRARLFIVVFGQVAREWVQNRLIEASKLILVNSLPTKIGVYVAPPRKPVEHLEFPYPVAMNSEQFDPASIDPLLQTAVAGA